MGDLAFNGRSSFARICPHCSTEDICYTTTSYQLILSTCDCTGTPSQFDLRCWNQNWCTCWLPRLITSIASQLRNLSEVACIKIWFIPGIFNQIQIVQGNIVGLLVEHCKPIRKLCCWSWILTLQNLGIIVHYLPLLTSFQFIMDNVSVEYPMADYALESLASSWKVCELFGIICGVVGRGASCGKYWFDNEEAALSSALRCKCSCQPWLAGI